jgi:hypothetical protein
LPSVPWAESIDLKREKLLAVATPAGFARRRVGHRAVSADWRNAGCHLSIRGALCQIRTLSSVI